MATIDTWNPSDGIMPSKEEQEAEASLKETAVPDELVEKVSGIAIASDAPAPTGATSAPPQAADAPAAAPPAESQNGQPPEGDTSVSSADVSLMRKILQNKLVQSKNSIEIVRSNPNSPLYSVKSFEELRLPEELLKGLYDMGFQAPSKIQETALPILLANPPQNMIAQSQSGTGKTAAFLLASLFRVDTRLDHPQVLILAPTYELAVQTGNVAKTMAKFKSDLTFVYAVKGTEIARGDKVREHVIIGTPGKVMDWALKYSFFDIKRIRVFVLDEADVMIDTQGHRQQSIRIQKSLSLNCQMMFFSATYDDKVMEFADMIVPNPVIIKLKREEESLDNIKQYFVECPNEQAKYEALANFFGTLDIGQTFIFCATKKSASWLATKLKKDGHAVGLISSELTVEERAAALKRFRDGEERVMICTNVMARGIDVDQVTVVINYDLPINNETKEIDFETYLHRIGRTGRFGKSGLAFNFVDSARTYQMILLLESRFGKKIEKLDARNADEIEKINQ